MLIVKIYNEDEKSWFHNGEELRIDTLINGIYNDELSKIKNFRVFQRCGDDDLGSYFYEGDIYEFNVFSDNGIYSDIIGSYTGEVRIFAGNVMVGDYDVDCVQFTKFIKHYKDQ